LRTRAFDVACVLGDRQDFGLRVESELHIEAAIGAGGNRQFIASVWTESGLIDLQLVAAFGQRRELVQPLIVRCGLLDVVGRGVTNGDEYAWYDGSTWVRDGSGNDAAYGCEYWNACHENGQNASENMLRGIQERLRV